jgi:hypothetical protein
MPHMTVLGQIPGGVIGVVQGSRGLPHGLRRGLGLPQRAD